MRFVQGHYVALWGISWTQGLHILVLIMRNHAHQTFLVYPMRCGLCWDFMRPKATSKGYQVECSLLPSRTLLYTTNVNFSYLDPLPLHYTSSVQSSILQWECSVCGMLMELGRGKLKEDLYHLHSDNLDEICMLVGHTSTETSFVTHLAVFNVMTPAWTELSKFLQLWFVHIKFS